METKTEAKFGVNVGEMMAASLAAVGRSALFIAGRYPCETDYLAAQGRKFPSDIPRPLLDMFNLMTLNEDGDDSMASELRYNAVSIFFEWHGDAKDFKNALTRKCESIRHRTRRLAVLA
jgi:hypothetical protein